MKKTLSAPELKPKLERIKLLIFDVDGVLTDGSAYFNADGLAMKPFSMRDGFGFVMAKFAGIELGAITGNVADLVKRRLEQFNITRIKGGHFSKISFYEEMLWETGIAEEDTAFIGDDLFDLPVLRRVGLSVAPADAHPDVLAEVDAVTGTNGGKGAVRELIEGLVKAQGKWDTVLQAIADDKAGGR